MPNGRISLTRNRGGSARSQIVHTLPASIDPAGLSLIATIFAKDVKKAAISEGHKHHYRRGFCRYCGFESPSYGLI